MNRSEWEKQQKTKTASQTAEPYIVGNTITDVFGNVLQGGLKGLEGIFDIGATAVGAVGGLFDKEFKADVQEKVKYDWTASVLDIKKAQGGSLINRMGDKGQMVTRGVAQGVGQMLPALGANIILPGSGLYTLGASAAGTGTEQAWNEGADYKSLKWQPRN